MKTKRLEKIVSYLKSKYPDYQFETAVINEDSNFTSIVCYNGESFHSAVISLNIRLNPKRYKEIVSLLDM